MALNDVALCSRALIRIGANPITSFTDGSVEAEIASALFEPTTNALLSSYQWSFATKQVALTLLGNDPAADYSHAYGLPNDYLRALSAGSDKRGRGTNFRIQGTALHANVASVVLTYIYRPDEVNFPPYFDQAVITRLAAEMTIPVTENTSRAEAMFRMADDEFKRARQIDAQMDSPQRLESFVLTDVR